MQRELKVRVNCPVCGQPMFAKSLEGHLVKVHELTGMVWLRLNPTHPYTHEPEGEPETEVGELTPPPGGKEEGKKAAEATTPEAEAKTKPEPEPEPTPEA